MILTPTVYSLVLMFVIDKTFCIREVYTRISDKWMMFAASCLAWSPYYIAAKVMFTLQSEELF